jgi:hypothetical protein
MILDYVAKYSCYDSKQSSKVNLSVYFLPADGWEKVIKIRCFSNETAILESANLRMMLDYVAKYGDGSNYLIISFSPRPRRGGKKGFQLF